MKKLLALSLVLVIAGAALAYEYEGCTYRVGVFTGEPFGDDTTNLDYTPFVPFDIHLVLISVVDDVQAYELAIELDTPGFISTGAVFPNGVNFGGTNFNHIVGYGAPVPPSGELNSVLLSTVSLLYSGGADAVPANIALLPSVPSSIDNDGPALVVNDLLVRTNYSHWDYSGCEEDLEPGVFPETVFTMYGDGIPVEEPPVATQYHSLTGVKALFQ